jgi:hypothetical protein
VVESDRPSLRLLLTSALDRHLFLPRCVLARPSVFHITLWPEGSLLFPQFALDTEAQSSICGRGSFFVVGDVRNRELSLQYGEPQPDLHGHKGRYTKCLTHRTSFAISCYFVIVTVHFSHVGVTNVADEE